MTARRNSSLVTVIVLIISIVGSSVARSLCIGQRVALDRTRGIVASHATNLNSLNSFALGLLLGGLRGPLVMALWSSSENQKIQRDLEDFDTKVELIRLLQPEFDTVHIYQIWNKAYNISAQMANLPNKYTTILDALEYGFSVDRERPDDINILSQVAQLYSDKFGGSSEKAYFSPRLQDETLPLQDVVRVSYPAQRSAEVVRAARLAGASETSLIPHEASADSSKLFITLRQSVADVLKAQINDSAIEYTPRRTAGMQRVDAAGRRSQHDSLLGDDFNILPAYLAPRLAETQPSGDAADGSQLPYLKQFEPFRHGVSPWALSYNYAKRSQWLQTHRGARHTQISDRVIDARPALSLEKWSIEEWRAANSAEADLMNQEIPSEETALPKVTANLTVNGGLPNCPLLDEAIFRFDRAALASAKAIEEYNFHLQSYPADELTYRPHMKELEARQHLTSADGAYLQASRATGSKRAEFVEKALVEYQLAANDLARYVLRYFMSEDEVPSVLPHDIRNLRRVDATDPARLRDDEVVPAIARLRAMHPSSGGGAVNEDIPEIGSYIDRCYTRLRNLALVRGAGPSGATSAPVPAGP